ncbi:MAG: hypothetical protein LLF94_00695 [Chlamydiales bacterium]|nr:hypothetical protein [Chlamydiales bacterium]
MRHFLALALSTLFVTSAIHADDVQTHDIALQIQINCPESQEFSDFLQSIPAPGHHSASFEEWKTSFVANMNALIALVESGQVNHSTWGVNTQPHQQEEVEVQQ